ncbi:N-acyl-aromatic-L-amino acid amidohydrolase (carboxylate-forming) B-like [Thalassophryne amazonica]|uniref:N-acyl-aromatic-L-amino acid amidohydrolase (carboxylate-forming) B-like n=1 Tax=Thalassophryne amazonica TaxID=390379 RepID=UPI001471395E|nr:N-acyl-aromatic-L-amino acid amidohydrolase (carboxylate-forming) B-like [Thalassophryne amazonica]
MDENAESFKLDESLDEAKWEEMTEENSWDGIGCQPGSSSDHGRSEMKDEDVVHLPRLSRVAVCGGTHGDELSGVYLAREMEKKLKAEEEGEPVMPLVVMSNPLAVQQGRRYIDIGLNRCFTSSSLAGPVSDLAPYELIRSRELNSILGPKGSSEAMDLVCDLHNTTANMGLCLIAYSDSDWICLHICRHLQRLMPDTPVRYIQLDISKKETYSLDSVGKHGFALEIGPQPHGVVRSDIYATLKAGVQHVLDWVHLFNSGAIFEGGFVEVFTVVKNIDYPRDAETCHITAAIHPHIQDHDFCLLCPDDPLFQAFSGETLRYRGNEALYPIFVNEGAYYEKGTALSLAEKRRVRIPAIQVQIEAECKEG